MAYFDAVMSSYLKTLPDGRKVFYPRTLWGRGYILASEQDHKLLRQRIKVFFIVSIALIIGANIALGSLGTFIAGAFLVALYYVALAPYLVRGLQPSDEKMSLQESFSNQATTFSSMGLWACEISSLAFVALGIAMFVLDPESRLGAVVVMATFGLAVAVFTWMLILRRRASHR